MVNLTVPRTGFLQLAVSNVLPSMTLLTLFFACHIFTLLLPRHTWRN